MVARPWVHQPEYYDTCCSRPHVFFSCGCSSLSQHSTVQISHLLRCCTAAVAPRATHCQGHLLCISQQMQHAATAHACQHHVGFVWQCWGPAWHVLGPTVVDTGARVPRAYWQRYASTALKETHSKQCLGAVQTLCLDGHRDNMACGTMVDYDNPCKTVSSTTPGAAF